eukprot:13168475-Heterocapsa_arctica.AAC.1
MSEWTGGNGDKQRRHGEYKESEDADGNTITLTNNTVEHVQGARGAAIPSTLQMPCLPRVHAALAGGQLVSLG